MVENITKYRQNMIKIILSFFMILIGFEVTAQDYSEIFKDYLFESNVRPDSSNSNFKSIVNQTINAYTEADPFFVYNALLKLNNQYDSEFDLKYRKLVVTENRFFAKSQIQLIEDSEYPRYIKDKIIDILKSSLVINNAGLKNNSNNEPDSVFTKNKDVVQKHVYYLFLKKEYEPINLLVNYDSQNTEYEKIIIDSYFSDLEEIKNDYETFKLKKISDKTRSIAFILRKNWGNDSSNKPFYDQLSKYLLEKNSVILWQFGLSSFESDKLKDKIDPSNYYGSKINEVPIGNKTFSFGGFVGLTFVKNHFDKFKLNHSIVYMTHFFLIQSDKILGDDIITKMYQNYPITETISLKWNSLLMSQNIFNYSILYDLLVPNDKYVFSGGLSLAYSITLFNGKITYTARQDHYPTPNSKISATNTNSSDYNSTSSEVYFFPVLRFGYKTNEEDQFFIEAHGIYLRAGVSKQF